MAKYKIGQYVCFNESQKSLNSSFQELEVYDEYQDNQIANITEDDKYVFEDFYGEWDESIISMLSDDQRLEYHNDGVYIINDDALLTDTINEFMNRGLSEDQAKAMCTEELMCEITEAMFSAQEDFVRNVDISHLTIAEEEELK